VPTMSDRERLKFEFLPTPRARIAGRLHLPVLNQPAEVLNEKSAYRIGVTDHQTMPRDISFAHSAFSAIPCNQGNPSATFWVTTQEFPISLLVASKTICTNYSDSISEKVQHSSDRLSDTRMGKR
jgi:hypothetical protein